MASLRNLKKDINYLISEVISDAQLHIYIHGAEGDNNALTLIDEAVELWNQMYERTNNPDGKHDKKLIKVHYRALRKDLMEQTHQLFEKLSALSAAK